MKQQGTQQVRGCLIVLVAAALAVMLGEGGGKLYIARRQWQKRRVTIERIERVRKALIDYAIDNAGYFPSGKEGLRALLERPADVPVRWRGPYLADPQDVKDGWGRPFSYFLNPPNRDGTPAPHPFELLSRGRDNSDGGTGLDADIDAWDPATLLP